jgi:hypothetical protein
MFQVVYMYACMYVRMYVCTHTRARAHTHTHTHTHTHIYIYIYIYIYIIQFGVWFHSTLSTVNKDSFFLFQY